MDNTSVHKHPQLAYLISEHDHELIFLPPYSPIGELFSKWKSNIKNFNSNTKEELYLAIDSSTENISANDCINFYNHVREYAVKGVRRKEF